MLCSSCGREVSEESSFCPHCGTSVERAFAAEPLQDGAAQTPAPICAPVPQSGTLSAGAPNVPLGGDEPTGLGGWLVLPIIGLFATPPLNILALVTTILPMREPETWARLTTPGSGTYHVLLAPLFYAEAIMACLFAVVSLAVLPFVFRKSYLLPRLMIALYSASAVWNIVDLALTSKVASDLSLAGAESWGPRGIASVVFAVIWVLYFLRSRRVKATFVRPWPASRGAKQAAAVATVLVPQTDPRGPEMLPSPPVSDAASVDPVCPPPVSPEVVEPPADSAHAARPQRRRAVYIGIGVVVVCVLVGGGVVLGLVLGKRQDAVASSTTTSSSTAIAALVRVGDIYITQQQFEQRLADMAVQYSDQVPDKATDPEAYEQFETDVLEYMVTYQLAVLEAQSRGLEVTNEEIQQQIESVVLDYYAGDRAAFDEDLASMDMTLEQLELSYRESLLLQKVYDEVIADPRAVSDEEVTAYYEEHKADYSTEETRTARHILISPVSSSDGSSSTSEATADQWAVALDAARKVRTDLLGGAEWASEAAEYSDDPGTKDSGGDLGVVSRGQMVQEFEDAVFSLDVGELSQPVRTSYGYHIVEVTAITDAGQIPLDQVKDDIVWAKWIEKRKAELVIYLGG